MLLSVAVPALKSISNLRSVWLPRVSRKLQLRWTRSLPRSSVNSSEVAQAVLEAEGRLHVEQASLDPLGVRAVRERLAGLRVDDDRKPSQGAFGRAVRDGSGEGGGCNQGAERERFEKSSPYGVHRPRFMRRAACPPGGKSVVVFRGSGR